MSEELVRPNGKPYRPRKRPSVELIADHRDDTGVVVLRTHDYQTAIELASWIDDPVHGVPCVVITP